MAYSQEERKEILNDRLGVLISLGFSKEQADVVLESVRKSFNHSNPKCLFFQCETTRKKIQFFLNYGIDKKSLIKIIVKKPMILGISLENICQRLENLEKFGFSKDQLANMLEKEPSILFLPISTINSKLNFFEQERHYCENAWAITRPELLVFLSNFPKAISLDCNKNGNMDKKLRLMYIYYKGNKEEMLKNYGRFMQSVKKTLNRINILRSKGMPYQKNPYLFQSENFFKKRMKL